MTLSKLRPFVPSGNAICAVPGWEKPRLLFPSGTPAERWNRSGLFPAFKLRGRIRRAALRCLVTAFPRSRIVGADGDGWELGEFLNAHLPDVRRASVLVGTPGPVQKLTVELRDQTDAVVAYGKYADTPAAIARLDCEYRILTRLPANCGPRPLLFESFSNGHLLVVEPLVGEAVPVTLPADERVRRFVRALIRADSHDLGSHPWVNAVKPMVPGLDSMLTPLAGRQWPSAISHGDFAPWNLRQHGDSVVAFDWEYGTLNGFPLLDLAFFYLQTAALIHGLEPDTALGRATAFLQSEPLLESDAGVAEAVVRLAAVQAYIAARADGHSDSAPLQAWRLKLVSGIR